MTAEQAPEPANKLPMIPFFVVAIAGVAASALWASQTHLFGPSLEATQEDMGIAAAVEITNKGTDPVVINEIRVNGRDRKECIAKPNARFDVGGSYRMGVVYYFCGKVVRVLVKTNYGDQEFTW